MRAEHSTPSTPTSTESAIADMISEGGGNFQPLHPSSGTQAENLVSACLHDLRSCYKHHPGASLVTALAAGILVGWVCQRQR